jgi:SAM-dependent methyltransferase
MVLSSSPEYVTDVTYVRAFEPDLSPAKLRIVAALNGFLAPPADDFDYCELGCAHGDTTAGLAAAFPKSRFVGVDINAKHITSARELARGGELHNVRFLERDFEDLAKEDLPDFDFITAHGVLSWVGPHKRRAVVDFAQRRLKPGGLLYVSYNALPGWAAVEPLRQLILAKAALASGNSLERARQGVLFARLMEQKGAEYFKSNPGAKAMLEAMDKHGLAYVVHEYLHAHWVPMYFAQVASEMAASDLFFVGQAPLYLNYRDIAIPSSLAPVFQEIKDRITFESLKDFALNEYFRRDVYIKGRTVCSAEATAAYFDSTPFGTLLGEGLLARDVELPHHTLHYAGEIFDALLPLLEEGAVTVAMLASRPELAAYGVARIRDAILRLALGGQVSPMQETTHARVTTEQEPLTVPSAYNRWVLREGLLHENPVVVASRAAGTAFELPLVDTLAILLRTDVPLAERDGWLASQCGPKLRLFVQGRRVDDKKEQERLLLDEVSRFQSARLGKMIELGIVARPGARK